MTVLTRREFLQTAAIAATASAAPQGQARRIAILATAYTPGSPAQHLSDCLLAGYPYAGVWRTPALQVVSLYLAGKAEGDLGEARAREFGFRVSGSAAEALRAGGAKLSTDGVLIAAGGDARDRLFEQCTRVFEQDGRAVPVFVEQQLSDSFKRARAMVDDSRKLRFPLAAGSSVPLTWRLPSIELPRDCEIESALMVAQTDRGYPALDGLQAMVERRRGGETGVRAVQLLEGDAVWKAGDEGRYSKELLVSALSRSDTPMGLTLQDGRMQDLVGSGELRKLAKAPAAYFIEYRDGLKAVLLMVDGAVRDLNFAARVRGSRPVWSTQFLMTPEPQATHAACLAHKAAGMFEDGAAPWPVERSLLAGGIWESCLASKTKGHARVETPHLNIKYKAPEESQFART